MTVIEKEFWSNVFSDLGFKKTEKFGVQAFEVPTYEIVYMAQVLGSRKEPDSKKGPSMIVIPGDDEEINLPQQCPWVSIKGPMDCMLNPMLSPSLDLELSNNFPNFFENDKKYLLLEYVDPESIEDEEINRSDLVDFRLGYSDKHSLDYIDEPITEYITSSYFRKEGYIVDKFSESLTLRTEGPDLFAIKYPELQNTLSRLSVTEGGFYLNELELFSILGEKLNRKPVEGGNKSAVIEAESTTSSGRFSAGRTQVKGYLEEGCYNEGYVALARESKRIGKEEKGPAEIGFDPFEDIGIFTTNCKGNICFRKSPMRYGREDKVNVLIENVERIVKLALLKNISLNKVFDIDELTDVKSFYDLYFKVDDLDLEQIVDFIKRENSP